MAMLRNQSITCSRWVVCAATLTLLLGCSGGPAQSSSAGSKNSSSMALSSIQSSNSQSSTYSESISSASSMGASSHSQSAMSSLSSSQTSSGSEQSSSTNVEPPFAGTVYVDPDIFTSDDPNSFESIEYIGRGEYEVYDSRYEPKTTTQNVYRFTVLFDDGISTEVQAVPAFNTEQSAEQEATVIAQALGRIPQQLRRGVKIITLMEGNGRANANLQKGTIRIYSQGVDVELREELLAHEAAHVSLDPIFRTHSDWLHAQRADISFISTYARDNYGTEDIAESVLLYLAIRYKSERISAENGRIISWNNAHRIAFFDQVFTDLYPMEDISQRTKARLLAPILGETLAAETVLFQWDLPPNTQDYDLVLGTSDYGASDLREFNIINNNDRLSVDVPTDGKPVYARLWTHKDNSWRFNDYRFAGYSPNIDAASIRLPVPNSQLKSTEVTFHWDAPTGANEFDLVIGSQGAGSDDIRASSPFNQSSLTVAELPENNELIYVRLWTNKNGWNYQDFEYTASQTRAELLSPTPGSNLNNNTATFTWSQPDGATNYDVLVGTNGPGSNNIRATNIINTSTLTLNNLPTNGETLYVRLWTFKGKWRFTDYTFNN